MQGVPDLLLQGKLQHFLTRPNEQIVIAIRKHSIVLLVPIVSLIVVCIFFIVLSFYGFSHVFSDNTLFILSLPTIFILTITLILKIITDWYFNIYIVTTGKLLEIKYTPLSSFVISQVLLDQVRCTEIDIKKSGIIGEFIDVGTIEFTFDRPTHQEHFYFENVQNSRNLGILLSREFAAANSVQTSRRDIWYKAPGVNNFNFVEEVFQA